MAGDRPTAGGIRASPADGSPVKIAHCPWPPSTHGGASAIKGGPMAKKPNYRFERSERARQKAAKKAARLAAKQQKAAARKGAETVPPPSEPPMN